MPAIHQAPYTGEPARRNMIPMRPRETLLTGRWTSNGSLRLRANGVDGDLATTVSRSPAEVILVSVGKKITGAALLCR